MTQLEMSIKEMYQAQAVNLMPSDTIKEKIEKSILDINKNNYVSNSRKKRPRRKKLALVFVTIFLLSSLTCIAALKIAESRGYTNVVLDYENFDILNDVAKSYGYKINAVKDFSNGYSFKEMKISYNQDYDEEGQKVGEVEKILNLEYRNEFKGIKLSIEPDDNILLAPKSILEEFEIDGVTVYVTQYIHLMAPEGYELTEEELRLQEEGILGTGTDSVTYEPSYEYYVILHWWQNKAFYSLTRLTQNATDEDLRIIAEEWIKAQK